ncbi:parvalbumin beta-like [Ranitomeya imitator]|uniref:parvalbumin beta-like n=1 Tax=Ranitomeya imitator TaxID=111125 RepID=UPI0037E91EB1
MRNPFLQLHVLKTLNKEEFSMRLSATLYTMTSTRVHVSQETIDKGLEVLKGLNNFPSVNFFRVMGFYSASRDDVKKIFDFLDREKRGFIEIDEVGNILGYFKPGARKLTSSESEAFMKAGDPNNTGKISFAGFSAMVNPSN